MDIDDILGPSGHTKRPDHPDFFRILSVSQRMKADMEEAKGDLAKQEGLWRKTINELVDFDSIGYHAIQTAIHIHNIETGADWIAMTHNRERHAAYVATVQAFYDGFIMGAGFQKEGGHQETV